MYLQYVSLMLMFYLCSDFDMVKVYEKYVLV